MEITPKLKSSNGRDRLFDTSLYHPFKLEGAAEAERGKRWKNGSLIRPWVVGGGVDALSEGRYNWSLSQILLPHLEGMVVRVFGVLERIREPNGINVGGEGGGGGYEYRRDEDKDKRRACLNIEATLTTQPKGGGGGGGKSKNKEADVSIWLIRLFPYNSWEKGSGCPLAKRTDELVGALVKKVGGSKSMYYSKEKGVLGFPEQTQESGWYEDEEGWWAGLGEGTGAVVGLTAALVLALVALIGGVGYLLFRRGVAPNGLQTL